MPAINMMTAIMRSSLREQKTYTLTLHFNYMSLFKRNKCCRDLIYLRDGNLDFKEPVMPVKQRLTKVMVETGIFEEKLYFDLYEEYKKHYLVYDLVPALLEYKVVLVFGRRFPTQNFSNSFLFGYLIPGTLTYRKIPHSLELPDIQEALLVKLWLRVKHYLDDSLNDENEGITDDRFKLFIRTNFLKQWETFKKHPYMIDIYMENQMNTLYGWAKVENKTIVKNIIERTQDEFAQEFLAKYQQNG